MHTIEAAPSLTRVDAWAANSPHCRAHYQIVAEAEPDVLCRVLNYYALQFLTPAQVTVSREKELLNIEIVLDGLSWHRAQVIGEKIRNLISVCSLDVWALDAMGPGVQVAVAG